jgi:hypothetical protein
MSINYTGSLNYFSLCDKSHIAVYRHAVPLHYQNGRSANVPMFRENVPRIKKSKMKKLNFKKIMVDNNPTQLGYIFNQLGQLILFFEHPTLGDDYPVLCLMPDANIYATEFFDMGDFYEGSDYLPVLHQGAAMYHYEIMQSITTK